MRLWFNRGPRPLAKAPFYPLAVKIVAGRMALDEGLHQIDSPRIVGRLDAAAIDHFDRQIRDLALRDRPLARALAELNARAARRIGDAATLGSCLATLGWLYREGNRPGPALRAFTEAADIFERIPGCEGLVAEAWRDIGIIHQGQGQMADADKAYTELERRAAGSPRLLCEAHTCRGQLHLIYGMAREAIERFQAALELSRQQGDRGGEAAALAGMGRANHMLGRLEAAERDHRAALELSQGLVEQHRREGAPATYAFVDEERVGRHLADLGAVLLARGRLADAELMLTEALERARRSGDRMAEQHRAGALGTLYQARAQRRPGRWLKLALEHHGHAAALAEEHGDEWSLASHLLNLGNDYAVGGRHGEARRCYERAAELARRRSGDDTRWRIEYAMGKLLAAEGRHEAAYEHYGRAIELLEGRREQLGDVELRTHFWNDRVALLKRAALCCLELERPSKLWLALAHSEQSRVRYLADRLGLGRPNLDEDALRGAVGGLAPGTAVVSFNIAEEAALALLIARPPADGAPAALGDGWQRSEDGWIYARRFDNLGLAELQHLLIATDDAGAATGGYLVEYMREREARNGEQPWSGGGLEAAVRQIYDAILGDVDAALARLEIGRVVLIPNLGMALLPLHACPLADGAQGERLLDRYVVQYAPSLRLFARSRELAGRLPAEPPTLLAIRDPSYRWDQEQALRFAGAEIGFVSDPFQSNTRVTVLGGDDGSLATPRAVLDAIPRHTFIHFACHGVFELADPLRSHLDLITEGAARAALTLDMILGEPQLLDTRMVVMSACETGMLDPSSLGDESFGLQAGFVAAGVPAVVATLWKVDDFAATLLMRRFYDGMLAHGQPPAAALREAQRWLRELTLEEWGRLNEALGAGRLASRLLFTVQRARWLREHPGLPAEHCPFAHPQFWAAFILVGE
jgi:CHAT domain-containing protein